MKIQHIITAILTLAATSSVCAVDPPAPCGAVPTDLQVQWQRLEWYGFVHFGLNTYTGNEWGYGNEDPKLFNPSKFDADKIVETFKKAGMKGLIYTAKHHDGFCLWQTKTTSHNLSQSPWKDGKGDVVREFSEACKRHGLLFGVYISPWDCNCGEYGRPGYFNFYCSQIEELLTNYGDIFEIWFDGARGGKAYYGGANENRNIGNPDEFYNFTRIVELIRSIQPNCVIWGAEGRGDVIWSGNELGTVAYPYWNITCEDGNADGRRPRNLPDTPSAKEKWLPFEADAKINRAGWFWHQGQASKVQSPQHMMGEFYMKSIGHGANLLLDLGVNKDGELDPADVRNLFAFAEARRELLAEDYALEAEGKASNVRGNDVDNYGPQKLADNDIESYWCTDDGVTTGEVVLELEDTATFDVVRVREQIRLGQRVQNFAVDAWVDGQWVTVDPEEPGGKSIGNQVMRSIPLTTTDKVRLRITKSRACPCINELSLLRMSEKSKQPLYKKIGIFILKNKELFAFAALGAIIGLVTLIIRKRRRNRALQA